MSESPDKTATISTVPLKNPYDSRDTGTDGHKLTSRIPVTEWAYIKRIYPMLPGLSDKLISNLVKLFIDHLKHHEHTHGPIEAAWTVDHPTHYLITKFLRDCERGLTAGRAGPRNDPGAARSLCEAPVGSSFFSSDPQSSLNPRGNLTGCRKETHEENTKEGQLDASAGLASPTNGTKEMTLEDQLSMFGVSE